MIDEIVGKAKIEFHPENGSSSHVVVLEYDDGKRLWFAYRDRETAESRLDDIAFIAPEQWGKVLEVLRP